MKKPRKPIHPKVKAQAAAGGTATAIVAIAAYFGVNLPLEVAGAIVVLVAGLAAAYQKSA